MAKIRRHLVELIACLLESSQRVANAKPIMLIARLALFRLDRLAFERLTNKFIESPGELR